MVHDGVDSGGVQDDLGFIRTQHKRALREDGMQR